MTGQADQFPLLATVMNLPKGVWTLTNGQVALNQIMTNYTKLIVANVSAPATIKKEPNIFISPSYNYVNVTVIEHNPQKVVLNASAETGEVVTFTIGGLYKNTPYKVFIDGNYTTTIETNAGGYLAFVVDSWSTHTITLEPLSGFELGQYYSKTVFKLGIAVISLIMLGALLFAVFYMLKVMGSGEPPSNLTLVILMLIAGLAVGMIAIIVFGLLSKAFG